MNTRISALAAALLIALAAPAMSADVPQGTIKGKAWVQTDRTMAEAMAQSWTVLPASVTGDKTYEGTNIRAPETKGKAPAVIFVHARAASIRRSRPSRSVSRTSSASQASRPTPSSSPTA